MYLCLFLALVGASEVIAGTRLKHMSLPQSNYIIHPLLTLMLQSKLMIQPLKFGFVMLLLLPFKGHFVLTREIQPDAGN